MANVDISVDYSTLDGIVKDLVTIQKEFEAARKELHSVVTSLEGDWQGKAQKEFEISYSVVKPKLEKVSTFMSDYAKSLETTTAEVKEYETHMVSEYGKLSF